jgi:hypothetical protein
MARRKYYASDILATSSSSAAPSSFTQLTEGTITGAAIGTVAGVIWGKFNQKNIYLTGFVGMIVGGVVSKIIIM